MLSPFFIYSLSKLFGINKSLRLKAREEIAQLALVFELAYHIAKAVLRALYNNEPLFLRCTRLIVLL